MTLEIPPRIPPQLFSFTPVAVSTTNGTDQQIARMIRVIFFSVHIKVFMAVITQLTIVSPSNLSFRIDRFIEERYTMSAVII